MKPEKIDIWSVKNKGIFIKGEQRITYEVLSKKLKNVKDLSPQEEAKLKKVCQDFESIFLYYLLKQMRQTVPAGGILQESRALQFYREMFDEVISEKISKTKGIGLADLLYKQIKETILKINDVR